jgi:spermidine synthase
MMGISFPFLQRIVQNDRNLIGRRVGWLQAANILGCTLGTIVTSWVFLRFLYSSGTLRTLIILGALFLLLGLRSSSINRRSRKIAAYSGAFLLVFGFLLFTPDAQTLWAKLHGTRPEQVILGEDGTGLSLLKVDEGRGNRMIVYVDGVPHTCFEIIAPQIANLRSLDQLSNYPGLRSLLEDDRLKLELTDGRAAIMQRKKKFDIIEADALFPYSAYSGNLYSSEYFMLVKDRLRPGGLVANWTPTPRIVRTFVKAFPYVLAFEGIPILIGSNEPIEYNVSLIEARLDSAFTLSRLSKMGIDLEAFKSNLRSLKIKVFAPDFDRSRIVDVNTDLFPKDEYLLP